MLGSAITSSSSSTVKRVQRLELVLGVPLHDHVVSQGDVPVVGGQPAVQQVQGVVLPAPFGPTSTMRSPRRRIKLASV